MLAGASQVHWWQLLTKDQRPLTMYPPSRSTACPAGRRRRWRRCRHHRSRGRRRSGKKAWSAPAIAAVQRTPGRRTIVPGELLDGCEHCGWIHFEPTEVPRSAEPEAARFRQCLRRRGRQAALTLAFIGCLAGHGADPGVLRPRARARARPASPRPAVCSMQRRSCSSFAGGGIDDRRDRVDGGDTDADAVKCRGSQPRPRRHTRSRPCRPSRSCGATVLAVTCQRVPRSSWRRRCVSRRRSATAASGSTRSITNLGMVGRSFRSMLDAFDRTGRAGRAASGAAVQIAPDGDAVFCADPWSAYTKACS